MEGWNCAPHDPKKDPSHFAKLQIEYINGRWKDMFDLIGELHEQKAIERVYRICPKSKSGSRIALAVCQDRAKKHKSSYCVKCFKAWMMTKE